MARTENPLGSLLGGVARSAGKTAVLLLLAAFLLRWGLSAAPSPYGRFLGISPRDAVWLCMQLHIMLAAFVLGVPVFAWILEIVGVATGERRYDNVAREFTRLLALAFTATAGLGLAGLAVVILCYAKVARYLIGVFGPTLWWYAALLLLEAALLGVYHLGWERLKGKRKLWHVAAGGFLNLTGTALMCVANAWASFMMTPAGVTRSGDLVSLSEAIQNPLWWPLNIHRLIANVAFGGAVAAAYAAVRCLNARTQEERAYYDWMGYVGNFVAMWALIPLPFAGYWLGREIYAYSAAMGTMLMGGAFSWPFIMQAGLIGTVFLAANYYMWTGLERIPGGHRYYRHVFALEALMLLGVAVWMTPHTLVASLAEARRMGGVHHPLLGVLGVMSAKNTAVNLVILATFVSFLLYRRANRRRRSLPRRGGRRLVGPLAVAGLALFPVLYCATEGFLSRAARARAELTRLRKEAKTLEAKLLAAQEPVRAHTATLRRLAAAQARIAALERTPGLEHVVGFRWLGLLFGVLLAVALMDALLWRGRLGDKLSWGILALAAGIVLYFGIKGYFVEAKVRIGYSVYQVMAVLFAFLAVTALDLFLYLDAEWLGAVRWGASPPRAQYALLVMAVAFTLTMGLMGYIRAGIRQTWHVYGVVPDTSPTRTIPPMAHGAAVAGVATLVFAGLLALLFRYGWREDHGRR